MANRFVSPFQQFFDATPNVREGGYLKFYVSGSATPRLVYSDSAASVSIGTRVDLDELGQPETQIFLANVAYKAELYDANDSLIDTADPVYTSDFSTQAKFRSGNGNPNGVLAGTAGSASTDADAYFDFAGNILYIVTTTGTASTTVWTAINASTAAAVVPPPQGRLTLTSATPMIASDVSAATAVYYMPYTGNIIPIYTGSAFTPTTFSELTLALVASHAASTLYDVFVFNNSGVVTIVTGPAWANSTAGSCSRGTGAGTTQISRVSGLHVNAVSMTGRNGSTTYSIGANLATYVGTILINGSAGQVTCTVSWGQSRKWGVWNAYNRLPIFLAGGDATATWVYSTSTFRASRADATNKLTVLCGLAEETVEASFTQHIVANNSAGAIAIGWNSTTTISGVQGINNVATATNFVHSPRAEYFAPPFLGIANVQSLEWASSSVTFGGTAPNMQLAARWRG